MTSYRMAVAAASLLAALAFAPAAIADNKQPANHKQAQDEDSAKAKHKHSKKHDNAKRNGKHKQSVQSGDQHQKNAKGGKAAASGNHEKKNAAPKAAGHQPSNGHSHHGKQDRK